RRIVDDVVPPDGFGQDLPLGRREIADPSELVETVLDMREIMIVAVRRRVGGDQVVASHDAAPRDTYRSEIASPLKSALAIRPNCWPESSSTAPFWLVSTMARAPWTMARPAPAA